MTSHEEGHGRPESGPPGGLVEVVARWEGSGGHWRVTAIRDDWIEIALLTCDGGEQVSRVSALRTSVLHDYLAGRSSSEQEATHRAPG